MISSTSLASEVYKHRKAREMRDAQIAAKLRQSVKEDIPFDKKVRVKKERSPEIVKQEPVHKEPEFSRKERLLDARDIVVKVENVQHNHGEAYHEERRVEKNVSPPRLVPHEPIKREPVPQETYRQEPVHDSHRTNGRDYVDHSAMDSRHKLLDLPLPKVSPAFDVESVSDAEPSPPRYVYMTKNMHKER